MARTKYRPLEDPLVDDFIAQQSSSVQVLLKAARHTIAACAPAAEECLKWMDPCYMHHGLLFQLKVTTQGALDLNLSRGVELLETYSTNLPLQGAGQVIKRFRFTDPAVLEDEALLELLTVAYEFNALQPRTRVGEAERRARLLR